MRVMRVIAGNVPYIVRDMSKTKYIYRLKHSRHHPHHPQSVCVHGSSLALSPAGNSNLDQSLV